MKTLSFPNRKSWRAEILREGSPPPTCHMSCVTCHASHVIRHVSHVGFHWRVCYRWGCTPSMSHSCTGLQYSVLLYLSLIYITNSHQLLKLQLPRVCLAGLTSNLSHNRPSARANSTPLKNPPSFQPSTLHHCVFWTIGHGKVECIVIIDCSAHDGYTCFDNVLTHL